MGASSSNRCYSTDETKLSQLTGEQREQLQKLLDEFQNIFDDVPGPTDFKPYHLDTGKSKPVNQAPYRLGLN